MFKLLGRAKNHDDTRAWITCLWMTGCVIMPVVTVIWSLGSNYAWFWEVMSIVLWAGLFWWTGESIQANEAAACELENSDENDKIVEL